MLCKNVFNTRSISGRHIQMSTEIADHFFENCGRNPLCNGSNVDFQILNCAKIILVDVII